MALNICNREAEAAGLPRQTGEAQTGTLSGHSLAYELEAIAEHCTSLPVRDARPANEILGYDERGLPR